MFALYATTTGAARDLDDHLQRTQKAWRRSTGPKEAVAAQQGGTRQNATMDSQRVSQTTTSSEADIIPSYRQYSAFSNPSTIMKAP